MAVLRVFFRVIQTARIFFSLPNSRMLLITSATVSTYDGIWISNEGASLDQRGKLEVWGDLPRSSG
jgi:hypothetical protein